MSDNYTYYASTEEVLNLSSSDPVYGIRVWRRKAGSNGKGSKVGLLLGSDLPELLRNFAKLYEQEGGWEGVAAAMATAKREDR